MVDNREIPLIEFETDASAPILRYDVPSPSSYTGRNFIELDDVPPEYFSKDASTKPTAEDIIKNNQEAIFEYLSGVSMKELEALVYTFGLEEVFRKEVVDLSRARLIDTASGTMIALPLEHENMNIAYRYGAGSTDVSPGGDPGTPRGGIERPSVRSAEVVKIYDETLKKVKEEDTLEMRYEIFKSCLHIAVQEGKYPVFYRTMGGKLKLRFVEVPGEARPVLMFIETYRLTSYPGDYGAGTTVKTFSLLPGEETEISIKTWKKSTTSEKQASSILDSYTEDKADEFEKGVQKECSMAAKVENTSSYSIKASASAGWGWGSASVKGEKSGSSNKAREESAKNVVNATEKHSQTASAKRDINVDTSYERTAEQGEEETINRKLRNLNASRTLNFIFRQMNQEFHSILHLTDVRLAFYNGYPGSMKEFALYELSDLVKGFMKPEVPSNSGNVDTVRYLEKLVMGEYGADRVYDYQGYSQTLVEMVELPAEPGGAVHTYLRVIPPRKDPETGEQIGRQKYILRDKDEDKEEDARYVEGIITSAKRFTMRTDGLIVESLLGKSPALDKYALNTQIEVLREKQLGNERIQAALELVKQLMDQGKLDEAVKAYKEMFVPQPKPE